MTEYRADSIQVLEGLTPVRKNPGMYIGGRDSRALQHLVHEVVDNAMDEVLGGHATRIEVTLHEDGAIDVADDGRGIPIDRHPRYPEMSALEVVLSTLHAGGKFDTGEAYHTSGGLHGVGISVVNALSAHLVAEVGRGKSTYRVAYARGELSEPLRRMNRPAQGTRIRFVPDPEIFGELRFDAAQIYRLLQAKAYLTPGLRIAWQCPPGLARAPTPAKAELHCPNGLSDEMHTRLKDVQTLTPVLHHREETPRAGQLQRIDLALCWTPALESQITTFVNAIPTPEHGTHLQGLRSALAQAFRDLAQQHSRKRAAEHLSPDDILADTQCTLSVLMRAPEFSGQTKARLGTASIQRGVHQHLEGVLAHWLRSLDNAPVLLDAVIARADERLRRKKERETRRKSATARLRLPGKLTDCRNHNTEDTELFIVEGDSAGGSAKQARKAATQAILPLRGKILNVASATRSKIRDNREIRDLLTALGAEGTQIRRDQLRYGRIIIMTDADVDGAHIASLLMTCFFVLCPWLIEDGRLWLALPPLFRIAAGADVAYARTDEELAALRADKRFRAARKPRVSRFKGLGEMMPDQLKETAMDPATRSLARIELADSAAAQQRVDDLMGKDPKTRYRFLTANAIPAPAPTAP